VIPVGRLAIEQVLGRGVRLDGVVGHEIHQEYHGAEVDVIALPHPSGASTWYKVEPGRTLLEGALRLLGRHAEIRRTFPEER
jgi:uracil-DNA glycosylase